MQNGEKSKQRYWDIEPLVPCTIQPFHQMSTVSKPPFLYPARALNEGPFLGFEDEVHAIYRYV